MPLALTQAQEEKKLYRRLLFCVFQPDYYDNKLQSGIWHLRELVFIKGGSPAKCSSLLSVICSMRFLTHTDPCRRRKWNCMKLQAIRKSDSNSLYFLLSSWASSLKGFYNSSFVLLFTGNLLAQDHSVSTFFGTKLYRHYNAWELWVFSYARFHKLYLLQELSYCSRADWQISTNNKRTNIKF